MSDLETIISDAQATVFLSLPKNGPFKPFETRLLSAGTWLVQPVKDEGLPKELWAYSSTNLERFATTFYISYAGINVSLPMFYKQFPSNYFATQEEAIKNHPKQEPLKLKFVSIVTFFISTENFNDPKLIGGGLTLSLEKMGKG